MLARFRRGCVVSRTFVAVVFVFVLPFLLGVLADGGQTEARAPGAEMVPGRYIVILQPGVDAASVAASHGARPDHAYERALNGFAGPLSSQQVASLRADPRVLFIEQDQVVSIATQEIPTGISRIFAPGNENIGINGVDDYRVDVDVAVIDTGIDLGHPDLNVVASTDCSGGSPFRKSCGSGGDDDHGHGTHVAGTIAAIDNGIGVVGVAPGARLWAVKVLSKSGSGYMSWIIAGVEYVTENAAQIDVANMSLGCECSSAALDTAIGNSVAAGVVYVVAAGNSAKDASTFSPANHPDVITVSALADFDGAPGGLGSPTCRNDEDDTLANFSNHGSKIDITAPGVCILSTVPGGYATYSGTSMAAPHVAGAAALLASMNSPTSKAGVQVLAQTLLENGNYDWVDDSGDGIQEPLLDVSNSTVFNPVVVAGGGGSTITDDPPSVSIMSPTDGSTVSGTIIITASASDDNGVTQVEFFVDGVSIGVDIDGTDGWSANWDTTTVGDGWRVLTAMATDTAGQSATSSGVTVTVDNAGVGDGGDASVMSAGLSGTSTNAGSTWIATVTITVTDGNGTPLEGALLSGTWSWNGSTEAVSCTTGGGGTCAVSKTLAKRIGSVTFQVTGVALDGYSYDGGNPSLRLSKP
jgi:subtilisin